MAVVAVLLPILSTQLLLHGSLPMCQSLLFTKFHYINSFFVQSAYYGIRICSILAHLVPATSLILCVFFAPKLIKWMHSFISKTTYRISVKFGFGIKVVEQIQSLFVSVKYKVQPALQKTQIENTNRFSQKRLIIQQTAHSIKYISH